MVSDTSLNSGRLIMTAMSFQFYCSASEDASWRRVFKALL